MPHLCKTVGEPQPGMTCAACVGVVENALKGVNGVKSAGATCHGRRGPFLGGKKRGKALCFQVGIEIMIIMMIMIILITNNNSNNIYIIMKVIYIYIMKVIYRL